MKILALILSLTVAAFAAAPVVTIDDNLNAYVDGSNWGKAGDVIVNNKDNAALVVAVNNALTAKLAALKAVSDAAVKAAQDKATADVAKAKADAQAERDEAIAAAKAEKDAALAAKAAAETAKAAAESAKAAAETRVANIVSALSQTQIAAPLPAPVAQAMQDEATKKKAALAAQKAAIDAEMAKLP